MHSIRQPTASNVPAGNSPQRLPRGQRGLALTVVLGFLVVAVPLITTALALSSTLSINSRVLTNRVKQQYCLLGAQQYGLYLLEYQAGFAQNLQSGVPYSTSITCQGQSVPVTLVKLSSPPSNIQPPSADPQRHTLILKSVTPATATPNVQTTFTYTIQIANEGNASWGLTSINDSLPDDFTYVSGSTHGATTANPNISGQNNLKWSVNYTLQPQQSISLTFQARATLDVGNYCNEAWGDPEGKKSSTGLTAKIVAGSPASSDCTGKIPVLTKTVSPSTAAANVATTYTYTIAFQNAGSVTLHLTSFQDLLPAGFTYVTGSTTGGVTTMNPSTSMSQGQQQLTWNLSPSVAIAPQTTALVTFRASANVVAGNYWNQAWANFSETNYSSYTWPTAMVQVMGVFSSKATLGSTNLCDSLWVGDSTASITQQYFGVC